MNLIKLYHSLGPGILLAGTAVGVSHIVQSVQSGAKFGFSFILAIIAAHLIKYPFFDFAPRYSSVTGRSLLYGYFYLGRPVLVIYLILTLLSMFTIQAAVTIVASAILNNVFHFDINIKIWAIILLVICSTILLIGKYNLLDKLVKIIILTLSLTTIIAVITAFNKAMPGNEDLMTGFSFNNHLHIIFLIGFLGWMPCPLDCAVWNSIWIVEKNHDHINKINHRQTMLDFRIGYVLTAILAIFFLSLGALVIYGTPTELSPKGTIFIGQLFSLYTNSLGSWSYYLIAFVAFITMFSTVITCLDAFPRVLSKIIKILFFEAKNKEVNENKLYNGFLGFTVLGTLFVVFFLMRNMGQLISLATVLSFMTAPIFAFMNYKLVTHSHFPVEFQPKTLLKIYSIISIVILLLFSIWFLAN